MSLFLERTRSTEMEYVEKRIVVEDVDNYTGWFADPEPGLLHQSIHIAGELAYL
jgi:hypothetical protein